MTISLEEHVARAIQERRIKPDFSATITLADGSKQWVIDHDAELARAAIAAVREWEKDTVMLSDKERSGNYVDMGKPVTPAEFNEIRDSASIRESERAACEAMIRDLSNASDEMYEKVVLRNAANALAARKGKG